MLPKSDSKFSFFIENPDLYSTENKIKGFRELPRAWNFGKGHSPEDWTVETAIVLNSKARTLGFMETDAFPGTDGEIMVTIYFHNHYLEFTIEPTRKITFYRERNKIEISYQEEVSVEDAKAKLMEFGNEIWKSSVYFIKDTTIGESIGLLVSPSKTIPGQIQGFPLLAESAYKMWAIPSAIT